MNLPSPSPSLVRRLGCVAAATGLVLSLPAAHAAAQGAIPGYVVLPLVPMQRANQATVHAEVNGRSTMLILDTGAPMTLLDSAFYRGSLPKTGETKLDDLPPELRRKTDANGQKAGFAMAGSLKLGNLDLGKRPVVLTDLSTNLGRYNNYHAKGAVSGLLGEDILRQYGAIIDWRRRGVYLNVDKSKRLKLGPGLVAAGWTAVPMSSTSGHHFSVESVVEGKPVRLLVDTGAQFTTFTPGIVTFSHMLYHRNGDAPIGTRIQSTGVAMSMINSSSTAYPARIEHWKLGGFEIASAVISVSAVPPALMKESSAGEGPMLGLVGAEMLSVHHAIIDVAGSTLYLKSDAH